MASVIGDDVPSKELKPKLSKPKRDISAHDLAAYAILDAAWLIVHEHHNDLPFTAKQWRERNKRDALELHEAGRTPDDIVQTLLVAYEHPNAVATYGGVVMLAKLRAYWPGIKQIESGAYGGLKPWERLQRRAPGEIR